MPTLSVVIPALNEEDGIAEILQRVLAVREPLAQMGIGLEVLVVDDGSRDKTPNVVGQFRDVRLIRHLTNRGYGAAIKTGFRHASGDYLAFLDADGTYPPEYFPNLCRAALDQNADVVVGSRMLGERSEMPPTRRIGNYAYARLLSLIGNVAVSDTASGMRVLRRQALDRLYPLPDGLQFTPAMSTRAIHENLKIVEVPIPYAERVGRSKLSVVRDGLRFTNTIVWTALTYNPARILGMFSIVMIGIAVLIGLYFFVLRLGGTTQMNEWQLYLLFAAVVLVIVGISLFALGAMFNYLVALFHKHPVRQGLFGKPIFDPPLDRHFGWMGLVSAAAGISLSIVAMLLAAGGWELTRLWFYLMISALLILVGVQLMIAWLVMRVLEELNIRENSVERDVRGEPENVEVRNAVESAVSDTGSPLR